MGGRVVSLQPTVHFFRVVFVRWICREAHPPLLRLPLSVGGLDCQLVVGGLGAGFFSLICIYLYIYIYVYMHSSRG